MDIQLQVDTREKGKSVVRKLRRNKVVPGIVYGTKVPNLTISAEEKLIVKYNTQKFENSIFTLVSKESKLNGVKVLMKEVKVHPVTRRPEHIDFLAIDLTKEVRVYVELRLEGKAIGLSEGGLLEQLVREVEVECLPTKIPTHLTVDITNLGVGDAAHLNDIKFPEGVKPTAHENIALATVTVVREEVVAAPVAAAAPGAEGAAAAPAAEGAAAAPGAAAPAKDAKAPADAKAATPAKDKK